MEHKVLFLYGINLEQFFRRKLLQIKEVSLKYFVLVTNKNLISTSMEVHYQDIQGIMRVLQCIMLMKTILETIRVWENSRQEKSLRM